MEIIEITNDYTLAKEFTGKTCIMVGDKVVSYIEYDAGPYPSISKLRTEPEYRGRHYATILIDYVISLVEPGALIEITAASEKMVDPTALSQEELLAFYRSFPSLKVRDASCS